MKANDVLSAPIHKMELSEYAPNTFFELLDLSIFKKRPYILLLVVLQAMNNSIRRLVALYAKELLLDQFQLLNDSRQLEASDATRKQGIKR